MSEHDPALERIADRYQIGDQIGAGGFSRVYKATHRFTGDVVAVKVTLPEMAESAYKVFKREAEFLVRLKRQPNIVRVTDAGELEANRFFLVMDYYDTSFDRVKGLTVAQVLSIGRKLAVALDVIHSQGIIHKDVKPANIFATEELEPALGDFGIATGGLVERSQTIPAMSLQYAAPEVFLNDVSEPPRDIYALGVTLYAFLEGETPRARLSQGEQDIQDLARLLSHSEYPKFENPAVTEDLAAVIFSCMAYSPRDRPTAAQLVERLQQVAAGQPSQAGPLPSQGGTLPPPSAPSPDLGFPDPPPLGTMAPPGAMPPLADSVPKPQSHDPSSSSKRDSGLDRTVFRDEVPSGFGVDKRLRSTSEGEDERGRQRSTRPIGERIRRNRLAVGLVGAVMAFVLVGFALFQTQRGPSLADQPSTDAAPSEPSSDAAPAEVLLPPQSIEVVDNQDGTFTVSWEQSGDEGDGFWISHVGSEAAHPAERSPFLWEDTIPEGLAPCFELSSVGQNGMSFPSSPTCP